MEVEGRLVKRVSSGLTSGPNSTEGGGETSAGPIGIVIIIL